VADRFPEMIRLMAVLCVAVAALVLHFLYVPENEEKEEEIVAFSHSFDDFDDCESLQISISKPEAPLSRSLDLSF
jgi:hypothetical protein